jgi:hypothetical protein
MNMNVMVIVSFFSLLTIFKSQIMIIIITSVMYCSHRKMMLLYASNHLHNEPLAGDFAYLLIYLWMVQRIV